MIRTGAEGTAFMLYRELFLLYGGGVAWSVPLKKGLHPFRCRSGSKLPASSSFTMQTMKTSTIPEKEKWENLPKVHAAALEQRQ